VSSQDGSAPRRVGLVGGTFDPVHLGHLVVAEHLLVGRALDEVRLLVAGAPWMKGAVTDAVARVALAQAAVAGLDGLVVDDRECRRDGPTYTADTLAELHEQEPDTQWVFCLGADAAASLHLWSRVQEVLSLAEVVVVARPGHPLVLDPSVADRVTKLEVPALAISSTDIRRRVVAGEAVRFLVPPSVHHQIQQRRLYLADHG
jgi:nicotinate-nucleotide adenylyltransferase